VLAVSAIAGALYAGCGDNPTEPGQTSIPANLTALSSTSITGAVGQLATSPPSVLVIDQRGDPMFGVQVTFSVMAGSGILAGATVTTNAQGIATVGSWRFGTAAGTQTVTASHGSLTDVVFTATVLPGAAVSLTKTGDNQTANVGTPVPVPPSVVARDEHDNIVPGVPVTFAVTGGGGSVTGADQVTSATGTATVGSWTLGTAPGPNTMTATAGAIVATFTATATVGVPATISAVAGDGQTAVVGSTVGVAPSVRIADEFDNPVAGVTVTFAVTGGGGSITGGSQTTDAAGIATLGTWILGTTAGTNTLSASAGALSVGFTAEATPAPAANIDKVAGDAQSATVGTAVATAPSVRVTDVHDNPVPNATVTFAVTGGGGSVTGATQLTDADGIATVGSWTLGTAAGANSLTATVNSLSTVFTATGVAAAPANMVAHTGQGQSAVVATEVPVDPAVRITDQFGNPVPGVTVTFAVTGGGGSATGLAPASDANGVATVGSWTLGTAVGANTLTATAGALQVVFNANATPGPAANVERIAGDLQSAVVNTAVAIDPSVRVTDAFGNVVPGVTVTFAVTGGGGSVTGAAPTTDAGGIATVGSWTLGQIAGGNSLTATAGTGSAVFTATGTPGAAAVINVLAGDGQSATVNTAVNVAPSVEVTDQFGNVIEGADVTFAIGLGGGSVTGEDQVTDAAGVATVGSWTLGTTAGTNTLVATSGVATATVTATGTAGPPAIMSKHLGDNQTDTVNRTVDIAPAVLVTDEFGNPVEDVSVTFVPSGNGGVTDSPASTNASGIATVGSWRLATLAGGNTLTASAGGLDVTFDATGTPDEVDDIIRIDGNGQTAPAGSTVPVPPSVRVIDLYGNGIPNQTVTFTVVDGNGSVTGAIQQTDATGLAVVGSWTLGDVGTNRLQAETAVFFTAIFTATATAP
jgi:adhesin/invasin